MIAYFEEIDPENVTIVSGKKKLDYPYLSSYWTDHDRVAYGLFHVEEMIGFCLINQWVITDTLDNAWSIAEFYIKPAYRQQGHGKYFSTTIIKQRPGPWEIRQHTENDRAIHFWRAVIRDIEGQQVEEYTTHYVGDALNVTVFMCEERF